MPLPLLMPDTLVDRVIRLAYRRNRWTTELEDLARAKATAVLGVLTLADVALMVRMTERQDVAERAPPEPEYVPAPADNLARNKLVSRVRDAIYLADTEKTAASQQRAMRDALAVVFGFRAVDWRAAL